MDYSVSLFNLYLTFGYKFGCREPAKAILNKSIEQVNFVNETGQSIKRINQFVENTTKCHIKDFIPPNSKIITNRTVIAIFDAAYLQGLWVCELVFF